MIDALPGRDPFVALFAESSARVLVTVADSEPLLARAAELGVPAATIGWTGGNALAVDTVPPIPLDELRTAWEGTLPALFG